MKTIYILILLQLIGWQPVLGQTISVNRVQSRGGNSKPLSNVGYTHTAIVGETATSSYIFGAPYSGSTIGFLHPEAPNASNQPPVARAGVDQIVLERSTVRLDGSSSFDPENQALSYQWTSLDGISLTNSTASVANFAAPAQLAQRKYRFSLRVNDGVQNSTLDTILIYVRDTMWMPTVYPSVSATYTGLVRLDGTNADSLDVVGTFVGNQCRSVQEVVKYQGNTYCIFNIQTNGNEPIDLYVYDYSGDKICHVSERYNISAGASIGSAVTPAATNGDCICDALSRTVSVCLPRDTGRTTQIYNHLFGCDSTVSIYNVLSVPPPTIQNNGLVLTSSSVTGNQWFLNGTPIANATGRTITVTQSGTYSVQVTLNGCVSTLSNLVIVRVGLENANTFITIYPNPVRELLTIETENVPFPIQLQLLNSIGQTIFSTQLVEQRSQIDLSALAAGAYLLKLEHEQGKWFQKIIK
jgi:Secretion system C-terminal sorting domain/PKD domain